MSIYQQNPWSPVPYTILKNESTSDEIYHSGFTISRLRDEEALDKLKMLFDDTHTIKDDRGGLFYSVYSRNFEYRKAIHQKIGEILSPFLEKHFKDYKVMINSFVIKASGPESEFYLHQDTTGLDERKYSGLNLWIPLDDVDEHNGALALVPKSHHFFSPFRSISFPAPFDPIQSTVRKYLKPIRMKKGEVLIFDNRVLHNSFSNLSGRTRVAVVCGVFPKDAKLMTCHKSSYEYGGQVELIEHSDDFLLTYPKFLIDCQDRPHVGTSLGFVDDIYPAISDEEFEKLCGINGVEKLDLVDSKTKVECNLIAEPDHQTSLTKDRKGGRIFRKILKLLSANLI